MYQIYEPQTLVCARTGELVPMVMQRLDLSGRILPVGAVLRITHKFRCENSQPMEALYISMLPRGAALRRFKIKGKGFSIDSELKTKKKARKDYEKGVAKGHLSSLAEVSEDGMVTLAVGQIRPREAVTVILEIVSGVEMSDRGLRFRFPFTIAPTYRSAAQVVSDPREWGSVHNDLVLPPWKFTGKLHQVSFNLKVDGGLDVKSVASPSHNIEVSKGKNPKVSLAGFSDRPTRDLVIDVKYAKHGPVLFFDEVGHGVGPQWTAVLPTSIFPKAKETPRKICFVIDRSGSMGNLPMEQAKKGLLACISALGPKDRFGVVAFDTYVEVMDSKLCKAKLAGRGRARDFINSIHARGCTELYKALTDACDIIGKKGEIFLFTDGQVSGTDIILNRIAQEGTRIHVLGIGSASQDRFLAKLATDTGGVARMVGPKENVGGKALELFSSVSKPVFKDAEAKVQGRKLPVGWVLSGHPVVLRDSKTIPLKAKIHASNLKKPFSVEFEEKVQVPEGILGLLWAAKEIESLESKGTNKAQKRLVSLGKTFGLASREMSLVAVVKRKGDKPGEVVQELIPVGSVEDLGVQQHVYACSIGVASASPARSHGRRSRRSFTKGALPAVGPAYSVDYSYSTSETARGVGFSSETYGSSVSSSMPLAATFESNTSGAMSFHSPELSTDFQELPFSSTATTASMPVSDELLELVAQLEPDGGMPGANPTERLLKTILLGLVALQENPSIYGAHLNRMASFLKAQIEASSERTTELLELALRFSQGAPVPGPWVMVPNPSVMLWDQVSTSI